MESALDNDLRHYYKKIDEAEWYNEEVRKIRVRCDDLAQEIIDEYTPETHNKRWQIDDKAQWEQLVLDEVKDTVETIEEAEEMEDELLKFKTS